MSVADHESVEVLDSDEALALLGRAQVGRIAVAVAGEPDLMPVNHVLHSGRIYFATAEGSKLASLTLNGRVAFETDHVEGDVAESVVVHGTARALETDAEIEAVQALPIVSWVPVPKTRYVEITPAEVTGRRFHLEPRAS